MTARPTTPELEAAKATLCRRVRMYTVIDKAVDALLDMQCRAVLASLGQTASRARASDEVRVFDISTRLRDHSAECHHDGDDAA
jgi:hypothetical protein